MCPGVRRVAEFCLLGRRGIEKIGGLTIGSGPGCCGWGFVVRDGCQSEEGWLKDGGWGEGGF